MESLSWSPTHWLPLRTEIFLVLISQMGISLSYAGERQFSYGHSHSQPSCNWMRSVYWAVNLAEPTCVPRFRKYTAERQLEILSSVPSDFHCSKGSKQLTWAYTKQHGWGTTGSGWFSCFSVQMDAMLAAGSIPCSAAKTTDGRAKVFSSQLRFVSHGRSEHICTLSRLPTTLQHVDSKERGTTHLLWGSLMLTSSS